MPYLLAVHPKVPEVHVIELEDFACTATVFHWSSPVGEVLEDGHHNVMACFWSCEDYAREPLIWNVLPYPGENLQENLNKAGLLAKFIPVED